MSENRRFTLPGTFFLCRLYVKIFYRKIGSSWTLWQMHISFYLHLLILWWQRRNILTWSPLAGILIIWIQKSYLLSHTYSQSTSSIIIWNTHHWYQMRIAQQMWASLSSFRPDQRHSIRARKYAKHGHLIWFFIFIFFLLLNYYFYYYYIFLRQIRTLLYDLLLDGQRTGMFLIYCYKSFSNLMIWSSTTLKILTQIFIWRFAMLDFFNYLFFSNLTKVYVAMQWQQVYCPNVDFVLKSDDDTVVDLVRLRWWIDNEFSHRAAKHPSAAFGGLWRGVRAIRNRDHKWFNQFFNTIF